ncbi:FAD-dependent oxidoreductase [Desulfallas sp. Bu1-1]|uniref:FAD-dependent oxidoreductase n=1 Tax=Desulfallas sp. Bu1-1 TaxID=2787620 RepID=UPI0018A02354|nr:FAD-dependent oxidoreductase [Desulfallas sp. Bu1-1]MBF7082868.1 FAD-dependent oxidoreductase [Desulfallas sp. Bu1-1]
MKRILINKELCQGCRNCQVACMAGHSAAESVLTLDLENPANQARNFVEAGTDGKPVPILCRHCDEPACVAACMSGALTKSPDTGTVDHDPEKCAGCWMCVMSCPYGIIRPDDGKGMVAVKCDFCDDRSFPLCVEACPTGAIALAETDRQDTGKYSCNGTGERQRRNGRGRTPMKYLILGASAAGISAARTIRELDGDGEITVISKDEHVYSRCMLHLVISGQRSMQEAGFIDQNFFEHYNIYWLACREAAKLDPDRKVVRLSNGEEHRYDRLLIATGASPVLPPVENLARGKQVRVLRNLEDALEIISQAGKVTAAVVVGAGLVGMDAAYALTLRGIRVSVVEVAGHLLPLQLDARAAERYERLCREHGMELFFNEKVVSVVLDARGNVRGVKLNSGKMVPCGMVIVAAGVKPNVEFLKDTTVAMERGIKVNEFQQTSLPDVFAAGDVCESRETFTGKVIPTPIWPAAVKQGQVAGSNMAGVTRKMEDNFAFKNAMVYFGLPAISFGLVNPPDESYEELIYEDAGNYKKVVLQSGRIMGAILQGNIANAGLLGELIKDGIDVSGHQDRVFELTYADFFAQKENGEFTFAV